MLEKRQQRSHMGGVAVYGDLEMVGDDGEVRYVTDIVEEARETVAEGHPSIALERLYYLADIAATAGLVPVCRALLGEIASTVPATEIDRSWEGWIANVRGRIESASRQSRAARASFERMRQLAISIEDREMEAIAHQNLGAEAAIREDHEVARDHCVASLTIKSDLGDAYGGSKSSSIWPECLSDVASLRPPKASLMTSSHLWCDRTWLTFGPTSLDSGD